MLRPVVKPALCVTLIALAPACTGHPAPRGVLQHLCEDAIEGFDGEVGFFVQHLETGETAAHRADELFPTASMIKLPILLATFDALERGALDYHAPMTYARPRLYPGDDLLGSFADGEEIDVARLCLLMATLSDNTASLWLQEVCGTGTAINAWLDRAGFRRTRVNSRTSGRGANQEKFGWGESSPREMTALLARIRDRRAVSPAADEEMHRILTRSFGDGEALAVIPPHVQVMSKQGAVSRSRSEVCLVHAPSGDYVFCVMTKKQADATWERDNEGWRLIRRLSRALWHHFEPGAAWEPAPAAERYW